MNGFAKKICGAAAVCAGLGLALSVLGLCMGGRLTNIQVYWDGGPRVRYVDAAGSGAFGFVGGAPAAPGSAPGTQDIRALDIDISMASVVIQTGDAFGLEVSGEPRYESRVLGGTWEIETEDGWQLRYPNDVRFVITVPQGAVFDSVNLAIGGGALTAGGLQCAEADLEVGAGSMTLKDFSVSGESSLDAGMGELVIDGGRLDGRSDISCGMGAVSLKLSRPAEYGYAVENSMGEVQIDGNKHGGLSDEVTVNRGAAVFYEVECGMGSVQIEFE